MNEKDQTRLRAGLHAARSELLAARNARGHWAGELSSSAAATATAVCALATVGKHSPSASPRIHELTAGGLEWLANHANADGGWGDTTLSRSNVSTTCLCWAALGAVQGSSVQYTAVLQAAEHWLASQAGGLDAESLSAAINQRYGEDRTFSVPVLAMCAIGGRLGSGPAAWRHVLPLPFELATCPQRWFAAVGLPVVSHVLPALIALGQARHVNLPSRNPLARLARDLTRRPTLRQLTKIQPPSGGFLEATPLTSFVLMSLAASGQACHPVAAKAVEFLGATVRSDGSWPVETNLATGLTTLAVEALARDPGFELVGDDRQFIRQWLVEQQFHSEHADTDARPGGWAWTDLPGAVPDADDTAGALLALRQLGKDYETRRAASLGLRWLLDLQNRDGGIPTLCRGWGKRPFDRSSPDLTAHAMRAWMAWRDTLPSLLQEKVRMALRRAAKYLAKVQGKDGWAPLWFGNQFATDETNLTYGNCRVLAGLSHDFANHMPDFELCLGRAVNWLLSAQNHQGAWGGSLDGPPSIEETALAVEALARLLEQKSRHAVHFSKQIPNAVEGGVAFLLARLEDGTWTMPSPIGRLYFANLWYYEKLYPIIFTVGALGQALRCFTL